MDIFKRIFDIIRANIETHDNSTPNYAQEEDYRQDNNHKSHDYQSSYQDPPAPNSSKKQKILDYYANLELSYGATKEEVKKAYYQQVRKYHPDLHHNNMEKRKVAEQITQQLNEAYKAILQDLAQK